MAEFTVEEISSWYLSKRRSSSTMELNWPEIKESKTYLHCAWADLDTLTKIARISGWISGEFGFEILERSKGEIVYFRHESLANINDPRLELAFEEFVEELQRP